MALALSTSWNAFRHVSGRDMLFEIKELGFDKAELSFNLTAGMVDEAHGAVSEGLCEVVSLHNFCPIPEGLTRQEALPDYFSMAATEEAERLQAVKQAKNTIDTALCLGAKAVVLHCGRVEVPDRTRQLIDLHEAGLKGSPEFKRVRDETIRERDAAHRPYLDSALSSLDELNRYAADKNILLGVETRFYYREIPSFEEIGLILKKFKGSNIYYWHDAGHAQLMENLGFIAHRDYLDSYLQDAVGIHLHNITGCRDHQAPSSGEIDFRIFKPYLKRGALKVIESHRRASAQDLREGKALLEGIFGKDD